MTTNQAAEQLGLAASTVRKQIELGRIRAVKRGRDWYITRDEVRRYRREILGNHTRRVA